MYKGSMNVPYYVKIKSINDIIYFIYIYYKSIYIFINENEKTCLIIIKNIISPQVCV